MLKGYGFYDKLRWGWAKLDQFVKTAIEGLKLDIILQGKKKGVLNQEITGSKKNNSISNIKDISNIKPKDR